MDAINTDVFLQKIAGDVGIMATGNVPPVHIIPWMPGMGLMTTLAQATRTAESELLGAGQVFRLDELMGPGSLASESEVLAQAVEKLDDVSICVIDCSDSVVDVEHQLKFLNKFLPKAEGNASTWLVTPNSEDFEKGLRVDNDMFAFRYKSRMNLEGGQETKDRGPKPKC